MQCLQHRGRQGRDDKGVRQFAGPEAEDIRQGDSGQDAQKHREAASDIWNVREAYLSLLTDIRDQNFSLIDLRARRDELQNQLHAIYKAAPHTNGKAYSEAQNALQNREDLTFTDAEIDAFLPGPLKRKRAA